MTEKEKQFITEIQTGVIIRMLSETKKPKLNKMYEALIDLNDAYYAAPRIPKEVSAHEAACQFLEWRFGDSAKEKVTAPYWALRN